MKILTKTVSDVAGCALIQGSDDFKKYLSHLYEPELYIPSDECEYLLIENDEDLNSLVGSGQLPDVRAPYSLDNGGFDVACHINDINHVILGFTTTQYVITPELLSKYPTILLHVIHAFEWLTE